MLVLNWLIAYLPSLTTAQTMKFSIKNFFSKCDQILRKLRIWSHLPNNSLMENFIFCAVYGFTVRLTVFIEISQCHCEAQNPHGKFTY